MCVCVCVYLLYAYVIRCGNLHTHNVQNCDFPICKGRCATEITSKSKTPPKSVIFKKWKGHHGENQNLYWAFLYLFFDVVFLVSHVGERDPTILPQLSPDLAPPIHKEDCAPRIVLRFFG